jgi:hypothetical protein
MRGSTVICARSLGFRGLEKREEVEEFFGGTFGLSWKLTGEEIDRGGN